MQQGRADLAELTHGGLDAAHSSGDSVEESRASRRRAASTRSIEAGHRLRRSSTRPSRRSTTGRRAGAFNYALDRTRSVELLGGPSMALPTCQLMPPSDAVVPALLPVHGQAGRTAAITRPGPGRGRAHSCERPAPGAWQVTVTDVIGDYTARAGRRTSSSVLRSLGYRVTVRPASGHPAQRGATSTTPRSGIQVESSIGGSPTSPWPSNFYELVGCETRTSQVPSRPRSTTATGTWTAGPQRLTRMLQTDPGAALRAWTEIAPDAHRRRPPSWPVCQLPSSTWLTSERLGNYQNGTDNTGPLLSQMWVQ